MTSDLRLRARRMQLPRVPALLGHRPAEVPWSLGRAAEWHQDTDAGGWQGRVVYAVVEGAATVLVEAWVHAAHLQPAG